MTGKRPNSCTNLNKVLLRLAGMMAIMVTMSGCRIPLRPIPGMGRDGRLYCYTRDYSDRESSFCLLGKAMTMNPGNGSWEIIPPPTAIFPGLPLYLAEQYVICPVLDTVFIPYDCCLKAYNAYVCAHDGVRMVIVDTDGKPIEDVEISFSIRRKCGAYEIVGGENITGPMRPIVLRTDANGELYLPIKLDSCEEVHYRGWAVTSAGHEEFDGAIKQKSHWSRLGSRESVLRRWKNDFPYIIENKIGSRLENRFFCRKCREYRPKYDGNGKCAKCGRPCDVALAKREFKLLMPKAFVLESEYEELSARTGLCRDDITEILGECVKENGQKTVAIRLDGKRNGDTAWHQLPPCMSFAEGASPETVLKDVGRSTRDYMTWAWQREEPPAKCEGFDAFWDAAVVSMRQDWKGTPVVEPMPEFAANPSSRVSKVTFYVGSRRCRGLLFEPRETVKGAMPTLAFFDRCREPKIADLPCPSDRTVLYLSVFPADYDYGHEDYELRKKYGFDRNAMCDMYAIDGVEKGREGYFFYSVLSSALRMTGWLRERTGADSVRCVGVGQGAGLAAMVAGLDPRVGDVRVLRPDFTDLGCPCGRWPEFRWHHRSRLEKEADACLPYFEACSFARRIRCPLTAYVNPNGLSWYDKNRIPGLLLVKALPKGSKARIVFDGTLSGNAALEKLMRQE